MPHRIAGFLVMAAALYFGFIFGRAFVNSAEYVDTFVGLSRALDQPIADPVDFLWHWRVIYAALTLVAVASLIAGVGLLLLKRWSWLVIAIIAALCVILGVAGRRSGYLRYGFEQSSFLAQLALFALALAAVYAYRNWGNGQHHVANA